ncbi:MAG TPA: ParB/Srx family N-terminal domain-containing protein [Spirochaetota bacterium]|nr:ParB/Srx family N-terminal domain-containing protein [Spirochaetota bacterium]HPC42288.1 ParB/Srx family N-terminal domain-containing protein [Spirochaetota bacterium]HPL16640.1 ParB/Srx family N-terminal domain-containing protein [Spirochaetota bacterium]HQF09994.1 ParB/Srx family N-terminal domain-containing protein [Spirochaetota bacterium]HQH98698.1 ParB/Srx family N-terminal domain-containing protein [Spirochaetota bacterium]
MAGSDNNQQTQRILLDQIDFNDRYYKISRNRVDDELRSSIREFGVLDPPAVIDRGGAFQVVFGFNRLDAIREAGAESAEALVLPSMDAGWYTGRALLKCMRNEIGPMGRIRLHAILRELGIEAGRLDRIAKKCLRLPGEFTGGADLAAQASELPAPLKDYLDSRDMQFRIIRDLIRLPHAVHEALSAWTSYAPLRVNIFRFIVDMLSDIVARDGDAGFVAGIRPDETTDRKEWEEHLYGLIRGARYPEYSALKKRADDIAGYFAARGIILDYPPYFEGDRIALTVSIGKRDDPTLVKKKIDEADLTKLKELLDLL